MRTPAVATRQLAHVSKSIQLTLLVFSVAIPRLRSYGEPTLLVPARQSAMMLAPLSQPSEQPAESQEPVNPTESNEGRGSC